MKKQKLFPVLPAVKPNHKVITVETKADKRGEQRFSVMWHEDNRLWDERGILFTAERPDTTGGTRGQYYYANLADNVKRWTDAGKTVEIKYLDGAK
jgi:hypothetical protein